MPTLSRSCNPHAATAIPTARSRKRRFSMNFIRVIPIVAFGLFSMPTCAFPQQSPQASEQEMHMHHHMDIPPAEPIYPRLGRPQEQAQGVLFTIEDAERLAAEYIPTLRQAEAEIRAAKARIQQAGLYPNPTVGYAGDEVRGGSINAGKQGFFAQQTIVTGGKLAKSRTVFEQESRLAELESEELATDIEVQRLHLAAFEQENVVREQWRRLAAVLGQPELPQSTVAGDLERGWPEIDEQQILNSIASMSPATRIADAAASRASAEIIRAKSQVIPDLSFLGGLEYNNEPLGSVPPHSVGWEGFAEVGVQLPIFNRNQGNIAEAGAELDRAQLEKQRIQLVLRERAASILDEFATAKVIVMQYRESILPAAKKANMLLTEKYGQMLAAYPRMLEARRRNFQLELEYVQTLQTVWSTSLALQGFLLTDGLEAPARPSDVDRPMRETNLPMPESNISPSEQMYVP